MQTLIHFMSSTAGRLVRILAGIGLIAWASFGDGGLVAAVIGALPLLTGTFDICLFGPLFGMPLTGRAVRGPL